MSEEQVAPVYVSPDGNSRMPVASPAMQINLEHRGWTREDGGQPVTTNPQAPAETGTDTPPKPKARRQGADE